MLSALTAVALLTTPAFSAGNDFSNRLRGLSAQQQRAVLRRAVLDDGQSCRRIGPVGYQQRYKNLEMWWVSCGRGARASYAAFIGGDGSVQVRPCGDLGQLKLPACRIPRR